MPNLSGVKPALAKDLGGTLRFEVPEGTPSANGTVTIYDENGDVTSVVDAVAPHASGVLSYAVAAEIVDTLGENYRARFTYAISGTTYRRDLFFDVVTAPIYQTLTVDRFNAEYFPILAEQLFPETSAATAEVCLRAGWRDCLNAILNRGRNPNLLKSFARLEPAHAAFAAAHAAKSYAVGGDWVAWGKARLAEANDELDQVLANAAYDFDDDNKLGPDEAHVDAAGMTWSR